VGFIRCYQDHIDLADHIPLVYALWLEDHEIDLMDGMDWGAISGMG
jgi:hypothetical protein